MLKEALGCDDEYSVSQEELARRLGLTLDRYDYLCRLSQLGKEVHFSSMDSGDEHREGGSSQGWDMRDTRGEDPALKVARELLTEHLTKGLSREERLVLILYYFEEMTMAEIGGVLTLSESRVSQIHKEILQRLRHRFQGLLAEELVA